MKPTELNKIAFIGAGEVAHAIAAGLVGAGVPRKHIWCCDRHGRRGPALAKRLEVVYEPDKTRLVAGADVVVLAVKPAVSEEAAEQIAPFVDPKALVITVAAGVKSTAIARRLKPGTRVVRAMPNTSARVRASATVIAVRRDSNEEDLREAEAFFSLVGTVLRLEEHLVNAAMAVASCGPAYFYLAAEAVADGGVNVGLPREVALHLAAQSMHGAGRMMIETAEHPAHLKDQITSPGGTTIAGLRALDAAGARAGFVDAVAAAAQRARELIGDDED